LATTVLNTNAKTSTADIEKQKRRINVAKQRRSIANQIISASQATKLRNVNRVQTSVKKMITKLYARCGKENYTKLEVPQGMAGSRSEWMKDDIGKIDKIVAYFPQPDKEKVQQGMMRSQIFCPSS